MQKEHDLADDLLLRPPGDDALGTLRPNPGHFTQAGRFLIDDVEYRLAKGAHELLGIDGPDAADHARAEVLLDPLDRRRRRDLEKRGSELNAVNAVIHPGPACLNELAG